MNQVSMFGITILITMLYIFSDRGRERLFPNKILRGMQLATTLA